MEITTFRVKNNSKSSSKFAIARKFKVINDAYKQALLFKKKHDFFDSEKIRVSRKI
jgi:hypothetical protein